MIHDLYGELKLAIVFCAPASQPACHWAKLSFGSSAPAGLSKTKFGSSTSPLETISDRLQLGAVLA